MPKLSGGPPYEGVQPLFDLARFPNCYVKFSTVSIDAAMAGRSTTPEFFRCLVDRFGARRQADRLGFGNDVELHEQASEIDLLRPLVDDDAHGAVVAMGAHIDDRARERPFPKRGHRDQELSFQTGRRRRVRPSHDSL